MRILVVVHGYPPRESGGTELHTRWLARGLAARGHHVAVFARSDPRDDESDFETWTESDGPVHLRRHVHACPEGRPGGTPLHVSEIAELYEEILDAERPDLVHVQHLVGSDPEIVEITRRRSIPMVATLHDYWYMCPRIQGIRRDGRFCLAPEGGAACAFHCSPLAPYAHLAEFVRRWGWSRGRTGDSFAPLRILRIAGDWARRHGLACSAAARRAELDRQSLLRGALESMDALFFPSEDARRRHVDWGLDPALCHVVEHGLPRLARLPGRPPSRLLRMAMTGVLMEHKGAHVLLEALRRLPAGGWCLELHGRSPRPAYAAGLARMAERLPPGTVRFRDGYAHDDLSRRLADTELLVIPSIWPETYNIVLREAWMLGIPVLASDVGGLREGALRGGPVTLVPPDDAPALAEALRGFLRDGVPVLPPVAPSALPPTVDENAVAVESHYRRVLARRKGGA